MRYRGRFAPSPTGPLHAGSLVAALASWLDARAHGGQWLVRVEDVDGPRCPPGMDEVVLGQLAALGLHADEPPVWQSRRGDLYQAALDRLIASGHAYGCACTRAEIAAAAGPKPKHGELIYPGTCRPDNGGTNGRPVRAWRFRVDGRIDWQDRRLGAQSQDLEAEVGDFVLKRADGLWAYQMAVVVDDAVQGITDVVRGEDLADNTPRQIALQRALGFSTPRYLHTPLVLAEDGHKLSKQNGAAAIDLADPAGRLRDAAAELGLSLQTRHRATQEILAEALLQWREKDPPCRADA
jgi:glutamyl-Q tRNA(Asp) synthetase